MSKQFTINERGLVIACVPQYTHMLMYKYGITPDDYNKLLIAQNFKCAICGNLPKAEMLHIDHKHSTLEVRGLLCRKCNIRLSALDLEGWLENAMKYIESPPVKAAGVTQNTKLMKPELLQ